MPFLARAAGARRARSHLLSAGLLCALLTTRLTFASADPDDWLARYFDVDAAGRARVARGEPLAMSLPADDDREVALLGAVRLRIGPEDYAARLRDIVRFKRGPQVEAVGVFSSPAMPADLAALDLSAAEVRALRDCRVGDCGLQLTAPMLDRLRGVDRDGGPDAYVAAYRAGLLDLVRRYQQEGLAGLAPYVDDGEAVRPGAEARSLVHDDGRVLGKYPAWREQVLQAHGTGQAQSVLYWSRERLGRASVVSVTHLRLGAAEAVAPGARMATSLQLYASHYFEGSLGVTILWPVDGGSTLVYYNRSRVDTFDGLFGGMVRRMVRSRARSGMRDHLGALQQRLTGAR